MAHGDEGAYDHLFKILLVGDAAVGKSSILLRFTEGTYSAHQASTIGVDFKVKTVRLAGKSIKLTCWDTAGQERFRTLTSSYYRGAQGILLVYDVSRRETFDNLSQWLDEIEKFCPGGGKGTVKLLVGNKIDLAEREVSTSDGAEWARSKGMLFLEASAKTEKCIQQAFEEVVMKILENPALLASAAPAGGSRVAVTGPPATGAGGGGGGCCG